MQTEWLSDFIRQSLLLGVHRDDILAWTSLLVEALRDAKPDHELHVFGVSRTPKMPNFLLGSSQERFEQRQPLRIAVNEKTADAFLAPCREGVRMLREEMPMTVSYDIPEGDGVKRVELSFYEAICFDSAKSSIIFGLILPDSELADFLTSEEIAELLPLMSAQGIPLYELHMMRHAYKALEEELNVVMGMMRESNPELARPSISAASSSPIPQRSEGNSVDSVFLQYASHELRAPLNRMLTTADKLVELSHRLGSPELATLAMNLKECGDLQLGMLKNLANIAVLTQETVRPPRAPIPVPALVRTLYPRVTQIAEAYNVRVRLEEHTRNVYARGDFDTLTKMIERFAAFSASFASGREIILRTEDSRERVETGFILLEVEDTGDLPPDVSPSALMQRAQLIAMTHPRLKRGGGLLYQLLALYMDKCGGKFRLWRGPSGGFTAQFLLPLVPRSEVQHLRQSETPTGF